MYSTGSISLQYVNTNFNVADLLTKGMTKPNKFARLRTLLGITSKTRFKVFYQDYNDAMNDKTFNHNKIYARKGKVTIRDNFKPPVLQPINEYLELQQSALVKIPNKSINKHGNDNDDDGDDDYNLESDDDGITDLTLGNDATAIERKTNEKVKNFIFIFEF